MNATIYCAKCKLRHEIHGAEVMYLVTIGSSYVCKTCKAEAKAK